MSSIQFPAARGAGCLPTRCAVLVEGIVVLFGGRILFALLRCGSSQVQEGEKEKGGEKFPVWNIFLVNETETNICNKYIVKSFFWMHAPGMVFRAFLEFLEVLLAARMKCFGLHA